jgi:hypothetical protein
LTRWGAALLAALALTVANSLKPLVIDDPVYVEFARQALRVSRDWLPQLQSAR